ncbi:type VI secretion protein [Candidatus Francisella endociliophora]|uniref:Type VI secretion protein n=1 Tax=Candidatus Francisella endociliophora TaxID=653937 RepID=A0A097EMM1_9GAMM|nr:type VI secretion system contractile sheath large subunit [Francisella sp. FSC1006]AIT08798.1 type VI secretion protein [Francisella sp. FSC1006]
MSTQQNQEGSLLESLLEDVSYDSSDSEQRDETKLGLTALLGEIVKHQDDEEKVDRSLIDKFIAEIDDKLSKQVDEILHNEKFQQLESAWRGLHFAVNRTDFRENTRIEMMNLSKQDLMDDFEDAAEISESGFYKRVYTQEYGQFGGEPYGAVIANYEFSHSTPDVKLLQNAAAVGSISHAPFISAVSPKMFGVNDVTELSSIKDLTSLFEQKSYIKWNAFRDTEDAKYVGLTMPKFLLREPYDPEERPIKSFNYKETVKEHNDYSWGNTAFAFATRITESFAKYRWSPNIIGPTSGGAVEDLPIHNFESMGDIETKIPTETLVSDRMEYELSEFGFIPLAYRKGSDNAAFFSANSPQRVKTFGISEEGKAAELNHRLGTQLPYMFVISRIAHYIKVMQREQLGSWKDASDLARELNDWLSQYVANQDNPTAEIRSRKPLREAKVEVADVPGNAGWYSVKILVRPHFKYQGADVTLSLVGRLDEQK